MEDEKYILLRKPEGNRTLGRLRHRLRIILIYFENVVVLSLEHRVHEIQLLVGLSTCYL
jgi:hypothetical protein